MFEILGMRRIHSIHGPHATGVQAKIYLGREEVGESDAVLRIACTHVSNFVHIQFSS